jgi:hypothetical protein
MTPLLGQNFRKFVIFRDGGGRVRSPLRPTEISATVPNANTFCDLGFWKKEISFFRKMM